MDVTIFAAMLQTTMQPQTIHELLAVFDGKMPDVGRATAPISGNRQLAQTNAQRLAEHPQYFATNGRLTITIPYNLHDQVRVHQF